MTHSIPEEIIMRSIQKTASIEELNELNIWLKNDKKNLAFYLQIEEIWYSKDKLSEEDINDGWENLSKQIKANKKLSLEDFNHKKKKPIWIRYIAAMLIGLTISSATWIYIYKTNSKSLVNNIVHNNLGIQHIILSDNSEIWLNENSNLSYPEEFEKNKRVVELQGKAYFDIKKDLGRTFIVKVGNAEIEVLGTEFFAESVSPDETSVALISGSINLNYKNQKGKTSTVSLTPGEQAIVDYSNNNITIKNIDTNYFSTWKDGTYKFDDESLENIIPLLSKHFGLEINISPSLSSKRFTGRIVYNEDIESVLRSISKSYPIKYTIEDKTIYITE